MCCKETTKHRQVLLAHLRQRQADLKSLSLASVVYIVSSKTSKATNKQKPTK